MPSANASFNLTDARFMYSPMQAWPRSPNPPIVEIMALQCIVAYGTWLCTAEELKPEELSPGSTYTAQFVIRVRDRESDRE
jgi:hypothetical protein